MYRVSDIISLNAVLSVDVEITLVWPWLGKRQQVVRWGQVEGPQKGHSSCTAIFVPQIIVIL